MIAYRIARICYVKTDISECSNFSQMEYKNMHYGKGEVISWELCNTLKFNHTVKWYMYKPDCHFVIQTNHVTYCLLTRKKLP